MTQGSDEDTPSGGEIDAGWDDLLGDAPAGPGAPAVPAAPAAPAVAKPAPAEDDLDAFGLGTDEAAPAPTPTNASADPDDALPPEPADGGSDGSAKREPPLAEASEGESSVEAKEASDRPENAESGQQAQKTPPPSASMDREDSGDLAQDAGAEDEPATAEADGDPPEDDRSGSADATDREDGAGGTEDGDAADETGKADAAESVDDGDGAPAERAGADATKTEDGEAPNESSEATVEQTLPPADTLEGETTDDSPAASTSDGDAEEAKSLEIRGSAETALVKGAFQARRQDGPEPPPPKTLEDDLDDEDVNIGGARQVQAAAASAAAKISAEAEDPKEDPKEEGHEAKPEGAKDAGEDEPAPDEVDRAEEADEEADEDSHEEAPRDEIRPSRVVDLTPPEPIEDDEDGGAMGLVLIAGIALLAVTVFFGLRPSSGTEAGGDEVAAAEAGEHEDPAPDVPRKARTLGEDDEPVPTNPTPEPEPTPTSGDEIGGDETGGDETGGDETGGDETGGDETGGDETGGDETGGDETGGDETGGDETGGDETDGDALAGDEAGGEEPAVEGEPEPAPEPAPEPEPGTDPRAVPPGTSAAAAKAFGRIPVRTGDGEPLGAVGKTGIHVDSLTIGSAYAKGVCSGDKTGISASATMVNGKRQRVYACVRIVHDQKLEEKVTVEWWLNGEKKSRTKLDVPTKHALKTVAFKSPGPGGVGEWEVRFVSEDKATLARRKFTVVE